MSLDPEGPDRGVPDPAASATAAQAPAAQGSAALDPEAPRCSHVSQEAREPLAGTAPRADVWIVVEHPDGWGDAPLARTAHGVRVVMARGNRESGPALEAPEALDAPEGFRVWVAHCADRAGLRVGTVADPGEVAGWDLAGVAAGSHRGWGRPDPHPLLLVCANARRDRCCGHRGGRLAHQLWAGPHAQRVLTCTHLGGHRFAPTALLLPVGALHGRLDAASAAGLLSSAAVGSTPAATLRGFSTLPEAAQVAEAAARRATGYTGLHPLAVTLDPVPADRTTVDPGVLDPNALEPAGNERLVARVAVPAGPGADARTVAVALVRAPTTVLPSCGKPAETVARWVASP